MSQPKVTRVQRFIIEGNDTNDELKVTFSEREPTGVPITVYPLVVTYNDKNRIESIGLQDICQHLLSVGAWRLSDGLRIERDRKNDSLTLSLLDFHNLTDEKKITCLRNVYMMYSRSGITCGLHIKDASTTIDCMSNNGDAIEENDLEKEFQLLSIDG